MAHEKNRPATQEESITKREHNGSKRAIYSA